MGENVKLTARDGHEFDAYRAAPARTPKGGIVVIQEIFGVNAHIREVADSFAADGYLAIAPVEAASRTLARERADAFHAKNLA